MVAAARPGVACRRLYQIALAGAADEGLAAVLHGPRRRAGALHRPRRRARAHQPPVPTTSDLELRHGMVFALEPKFVLPGLGAIGIENTWLVTADGLGCSPTLPSASVGSAESSRRGYMSSGGRGRRDQHGDVKQLNPDVWVDGIDAEGFPTIAAVVFTPARAFVVHAMRPQDMAPLHELLAAHAGVRPMAVNTHHHWDHVHGNAAFPGVDIIAQRACPRLIVARAGRQTNGAAAAPRRRAPSHDHVRRPPHLQRRARDTCISSTRPDTPGFARRLPRRRRRPSGRRHAGMAAAQLRRARRQGHLHPYPAPAGAAALRTSSCPATARRWGRRSSTPTSEYIVEVHRAVALAKKAGVGRNDLDLPAAAFLADDVVLDDVYADAHRANLVWAWIRSDGPAAPAADVETGQSSLCK